MTKFCEIKFSCNACGAIYPCMLTYKSLKKTSGHFCPTKCPYANTNTPVWVRVYKKKAEAKDER